MEGARRWPVIAALGILQIFAWGSSYYLMAVMAPAIVADTGWSLPWVVGALSVALLSAGLSSPLVGRRITASGGRAVLAAGCGFLAVGLGLASLAPNLAGFYLSWAVMGLGMSAALYDPAFATLGRLYGQDARSAITALTLWGGFASTLCWPLSTWLLTEFDWRGALRIYALILLLLCLPLIAALVPKEARPAAPRADDKPRKPRLEGRDRLAFRLMAAILVIAGTTVTIVSVHLLTLLQSQGISLSEAVAIGAMIGPAQVGARLIEMAGKGRHHPIWTLLGASGAVALGLILLAMDVRLPALAIILYGAGNGIFSIARGALPLTLFGPERYAVVMGDLARPSLIAQAAAPLIGGMLIAATGATSTLTILAMLGMSGFALVLLLFYHWQPLRS